MLQIKRPTPHMLIQQRDSWLTDCSIRHNINIKCMFHKWGGKKADFLFAVIETCLLPSTPGGWNMLQFSSSVHSDKDRSLLSRPVTKLSRSTAVTTPNTICFRLGEPSVKSGGRRLWENDSKDVLGNCGSKLSHTHYISNWCITQSKTRKKKKII